jgi:hypothetical protein
MTKPSDRIEEIVKGGKCEGLTGLSSFATKLYLAAILQYLDEQQAEEFERWKEFSKQWQKIGEPCEREAEIRAAFEGATGHANHISGMSYGGDRLWTLPGIIRVLKTVKGLGL